ncbi:MAG: hypothetical protein ACTS8H_02830 [Arsenophonus sp. NC-PE1-MAG3]
MTKPQKFKQQSSTQKIMVAIFCDWKGVLLIDFLSRGMIINPKKYCETILKLRWAIQNCR